jgi:hypothetical protein
MALKPWFPDINREATEAIVDGQRKRSDFNMFANRIVVDVKIYWRTIRLSGRNEGFAGSCGFIFK